MRSSAGWLLSVCLLAQVGWAQEEQGRALYTTGFAIEQGSGKPLYRELHFCTPDRSQCTVEYRDTAGKLFAHKELDYRERAHGPVVQMRDLRTGQSLGRPLLDDADVVVDAGFDNYVRLRWDELVGNKAVVFPLQLLSLDNPVRMRASALDRDCPAQRLCLRVEVNSWLLGLVADPITLHYDRDERRLLYFSGLGNIKSAAGKSQLVEIRYDYASPAAVDAVGPYSPVAHSGYSSP